jgi:ABC-type branched-subunit amino acid transport system substrate-binding protein
MVANHNPNDSSRLGRRRALEALGLTGLAGVAGCIGGSGAQNDQGPDLLNVIGYPKSGIQLFRDYYANFGGDHDIIVPDGLQESSLPDDVGNPMANLSGTAPAAAGPNRDAFQDLYADEWGESPGVFNSHTYDAMALSILANVAAGANDGRKIRNQMRRVANPGGETFGPGSFISAVEAAARGEDIQYQGASSVCNFDERGDPASAAYEVWRFGEDGVVSDKTIDFDGDTGGRMAEDAPGGTGRTIKVSMLLPQTGDLGELGTFMIQGGRLPVAQLQQSDLDFEVDLQVEDTQTTRQTTLSAGGALIDGGYPTIVGAASSGNSVPLAEAAAEASVVQISPASTALSLSLIEDDDYFFRTAPSDLLQGQVMAQVGAEDLGAETAATLYINNDYGQQLSEQFTESFETEHGGDVRNQVSFNKGQGSYTAVLDSALAQN